MESKLSKFLRGETAARNFTMSIFYTLPSTRRFLNVESPEIRKDSSFNEGAYLGIFTGLALLATHTIVYANLASNGLEEALWIPPATHIASGIFEICDYVKNNYQRKPPNTSLE